MIYVIEAKRFEINVVVEKLKSNIVTIRYSCSFLTCGMFWLLTNAVVSEQQARC